MNTVYSSRAAERVIWREQFHNAATVQRNGGTLVGSPTVNHGLGLNGTSQYASFEISPTLVRRDTLSLVIELYPDFNYDDGQYRFITDAVGNAFTLYKRDATSLNTLVFYSSVGSVLVSGTATYGPYWLVGERNIIVVSISPGDNKMFLNGHQIASSATAYILPNVTTLYLGGGSGGLYLCGGSMGTVSIHNTTMTLEDAQAIYDNSLFNYQQRASCWFDMSVDTDAAGTVRGTETVLTDGDMEAVGTAAWTAGNNATLTKSTADPHSGTQALRIAYNGTNNPLAHQAVLIIGKNYRVTGWARGDGTFTPAVYIGSGGGPVWTGTNSTSWQYFDIADIADNTLLQLVSFSTAAGGWSEFDDISVYESDEWLDDPEMEETGVADWTAGNNATLTKETTNPYSGTQVLRVTYNGTANAEAYQNTLSTGAYYEATGRARGDGTSPPYVLFGTQVAWLGTNSTDWQYFNVQNYAIGSGWVRLRNQSSAGYVEFNDVHVRKVLRRTLDRSRNDYPCMLGDGFAAAGIPTFQNPGFGFDGAGNYLWEPNPTLVDEDELTLVCVFRPNFTADSGTQHFILDSSATLQYTFFKSSANVLYSYLGGSAASVAAAVFQPYWRTGGVNVLIATGSATARTMWLNNHQLNLSGAYTKSTISYIELGRRTTAANYYDGDLLGFYVFPFVLSPIQMRDLTIQLGVPA